MSKGRPGLVPQGLRIQIRAQPLETTGFRRFSAYVSMPEPLKVGNGNRWNVRIVRKWIDGGCEPVGLKFGRCGFDKNDRDHYLGPPGTKASTLENDLWR